MMIMYFHNQKRPTNVEWTFTADFRERKAMYNNLFRIPLLVAAMAIILVGCASPTPTLAPITTAVPIPTEILLTDTPEPAATQIPSMDPPEPTVTPSGPSWTYVAFGDSWPYGGHCNCRP